MIKMGESNYNGDMVNDFAGGVLVFDTPTLFGKTVVLLLYLSRSSEYTLCIFIN